jgi:hypothetical protein
MSSYSNHVGDQGVDGRARVDGIVGDAAFGNGRQASAFCFASTRSIVSVPCL